MNAQPVLRRRRPIWAYLFGVLGVLLGALLIYNAVLLILARLDQPSQPAPGQLLYVTTFDAFNTQWTQFAGQMRAAASEGALHFTIDEINSGAYSDLDQVFTDFDVRAEGRWITLPGDSGQIGLLFRYQDRDNYYVLKLRADGAYRVEKVLAGQVEVISEWQISPHVQIGPEAVNKLRVVGQGDRFGIYVNDQVLPLCLRGTDRRSTWTRRDSGQCLSNNQQTSDNFTDTAFPAGKIALGAVADVDVPGLQAAFDNVVILGPQP